MIKRQTNRGDHRLAGSLSSVTGENHIGMARRPGGFIFPKTEGLKKKQNIKEMETLYCEPFKGATTGS